MEFGSPGLVTAVAAADFPGPHFGLTAPFPQTLPQQQAPQPHQMGSLVALLMGDTPMPAPSAPAGAAAAAAATAQAAAAAGAAHPLFAQVPPVAATAAAGAAAPGASAAGDWSLHGPKPWVPQRYAHPHADPVVVIQAPWAPRKRSSKQQGGRRVEQHADPAAADPAAADPAAADPAAADPAVANAVEGDGGSGLIRRKRSGKQQGGKEPKRHCSDAAAPAAVDAVGGSSSGLQQAAAPPPAAAGTAATAAGGAEGSSSAVQTGAPLAESATYKNKVKSAAYAIMAMLDRCWERKHAAKLAKIIIKAGTEPSGPTLDLEQRLTDASEAICCSLASSILLQAQGIDDTLRRNTRAFQSLKDHNQGHHPGHPGWIRCRSEGAAADQEPAARQAALQAARQERDLAANFKQRLQACDSAAAAAAVVGVMLQETPGIRAAKQQQHLQAQQHSSGTACLTNSVRFLYEYEEKKFVQVPLECLRSTRAVHQAVHLEQLQQQQQSIMLAAPSASAAGPVAAAAGLQQQQQQAAARAEVPAPSDSMLVPEAAAHEVPAAAQIAGAAAAAEAVAAAAAAAGAAAAANPNGGTSGVPGARSDSTSGVAAAAATAATLASQPAVGAGVATVEALPAAAAAAAGVAERAEAAAASGAAERAEAAAASGAADQATAAGEAPAGPQARPRRSTRVPPWLRDAAVEPVAGSQGRRGRGTAQTGQCCSSRAREQQHAGVRAGADAHDVNQQAAGHQAGGGGGAGALNHHIGNPAAAAAPAQGLTAPLRPPVSIEGREFQEGELSKDTTTVVLTIEEVEQMVHQTEKEVCKQLGIGLTFWKETISGWGIKPWPQRYCNRLRRCIADVEACRGRVPQDTADSLLEQLRDAQRCFQADPFQYPPPCIDELTKEVYKLKRQVAAKKRRS